MSLCHGSGAAIYGKRAVGSTVESGGSDSRTETAYVQVLLLRVGVAFKLKVIGKWVAVNIPIDLMSRVVVVVQKHLKPGAFRNVCTLVESHAEFDFYRFFLMPTDRRPVNTHKLELRVCVCRYRTELHVVSVA